MRRTNQAIVRERHPIRTVDDVFYQLSGRKATQKLARKSAHSRPKEVKNNPFEIHTNKRKHDILGRKLKHDTGLPGISRSKAIKKVGIL